MENRRIHFLAIDNILTASARRETYRIVNENEFTEIFELAEQESSLNSTVSLHYERRNDGMQFKLILLFRINWKKSKSPESYDLGDSFKDG